MESMSTMAFVTPSGGINASTFLGYNGTGKAIQRLGAVNVPRKHRVSPKIAMMTAAGNGSANVEEGAEEDENTELQGPSQAPTAAGVSTAGLSEPDAKFITACYNAEVEEIEAMIADGQDPNVMDVNKRTALHFCAGNGLPTVCQKLIDAGANTNMQDMMGFTPLHMATGYKKLDTVRLLVEVGADANIASLKGDLPVEIAENIFEQTPEKRFFMANEEYTRMQSIVEILDEATELEEDDTEEDDDESIHGSPEIGQEVTEETASAKFVVRVKPKGEATSTTPPPAPASDVKVTIKVKEPEPKK